MTKDIDRTLWVGNLSDRVSDDILYELFLQAGPLEKVSIAKDKDGRLKGFAFITFCHDVSVPYTIQLMDGMTLYGRNMRLQSRPGSIHQQQNQAETMRNPYQGSSPMPSRPQYNQQSPGVISPLANPYMHIPSGPQQHMMPGMMNQQPQHLMVPSFNRSHTWHGSDLSSAEREEQGSYSPHQHDRDSRDHRSRRHHRDSSHDRHSHHSRDRSGSRHDGSGRHHNTDGYRHSQNDNEGRRQRVLDKQDRMLQGYRGQGRRDRNGRY